MSAAPLIRARHELESLAQDYAANPPTKARDLHGIRIRIKKIRYVAELAEPTSDQEHFLAAMKAAQDALGDWHDWEELTGAAEEQFGDRMNCPLLVEVRALFAAKRVAAGSAVAQLLDSQAEQPPRKRPRAAGTSQALAQRA